MGKVLPVRGNPAAALHEEHTMMFVRLPGLAGNPLAAAIARQPLAAPPATLATPADAAAHACHRLALSHDDAWTALAGVMVGGRKLDLVVAGPTGLVAVRYVHASEVHITESAHWHGAYDHLNSPSLLLECVVPPPDLLHAAADELQRALRGRLDVRHIVRALLLVDPQATLHLGRPSPVDFIGKAEEFDAAGLCQHWRSAPWGLADDEAAQAVCDVHMAYVRGGTPPASSAR
jgi:hypothetical protein